MAEQKRTVPDACDLLESILLGNARAEIVDELSRTGAFEDWLRRLRKRMTAHAFGEGSVRLDTMVRRLDNRTRQDGFRVFHLWDHRAHRFTEEIVPVLLLDFYERANVAEPNERLTLEILLDYYLLHVLTLCAMRAWDLGDPDATLDRISGLVEALQGSSGSGHHFVADAETLLIYGLSQFHPNEQAYDRLIEKVAELSVPHQMTFARVSASVLSAHLRWGFWLMYERDVLRMRNDNVGDYPWLLTSVLTLLKGYVRHREAGEEADDERRDTAQGLLQGLAADPWAFVGKAPPALADYEVEYAEVVDLLQRHGAELLDDFEALRPAKDSYAPLALHFNFPHNTLMAIVTLALLEGKPQSLPLNALFVQEMSDLPGDETQAGLARALMAFSRGSPERLGYRGAMLVAYDHLSGLRSYSLTVDTIAKSLE